MLIALVAPSFGRRCAAEQNWPQWRGPQGTGVAPDANPPTSWSEEKNIKWKVKIPGRGTATPIIWEDRIFIQTAIATGKKTAPPANEVAAATEEKTTPTSERAQEAKRDEKGPPGRKGGFRGMRSEKPTAIYQFVLLCLDRKTGEKRWQKVAREEVPHEGHHPDHGFSSSSPVTDGQYVYAFFGSRGLHCYDLDGNLKWQKDLGRMQTKLAFGEGSSPALRGDTLVVNWDHEGDDFIVALDKRTGDERWRKPRDEDTSWATPLVVDHDGRAQVVTSATNKVRSYDLQTGDLVWEATGMTSNAIPTPVAAGEMVYVTSGFRGAALLAIRLGSTGDLTGTDAIAWSLRKATPYVPSPLLYGNRLYFFSGNNAVLSSFDAKTGEPIIDASRIEGLRGVYASPVGAGGHVYLVGRDGEGVVIKDADELEVVATNQLDERFDASPAIAGNELYLRGHEYLYCIAGETAE